MPERQLGFDTFKLYNEAYFAQKQLRANRQVHVKDAEGDVATVLSGEIVSREGGPTQVRPEG